MSELLSQVKIRTWEAADKGGTCALLKQAAYNNLTISYRLALSRRTTKLFLTTVTSVAFIVTRSFLISISAFASTLLFIYIGLYIGTLYYLHGKYLSDVKHVKKTYLSQDDTCFWVASLNDRIIGTIAIIKRPNKGINSKKIAWLRRMAVCQDYRRLGIGCQMVTKVIEFSGNHGYDQIELITTEVHEPARRLYEKMGFVCYAYKPYPYFGGLVNIWTYEFVLNLSAKDKIA